LLLITLLGVVWAAPASQAAAIVKDIDLGDRVIANIATASTDTVCTRFYAVQGTLASIAVRSSGDSTLALTITLKDDTGTAIDLGDSLLLRGKTARVRRFEILASGTYCFEIGATLGSGGFRAKTTGKFPRKYDLAGNFPADAVQTFDVMPWSVLKGQVKADRGSNYKPTVDSLADQGGDLTLEGLTAKDSRAKFKLAVAPAGGTVTCTLGGTDTGGFAARIRVKTPRSREKFDLTAPGAVITLVTTLSGTVSNSLTGTGLEGTVISLDPTVPGLSIVTRADGTYLEEVPSGNYDVTFQATGFVDQTQATSVLAGSGAVADAALVPVAPVVPVAMVSGTPVPGGSMTATASTAIFDGSTIVGRSWTQIGGPDIGPLVGDSPTFNLPDASGFKEALIEILKEPAIDEEHLPSNVHLPEEGFCEGGTNHGDSCEDDAECSGGICNKFFGGLQDRFQVVGVNPLSLEEAAVVILEVEVTTTNPAGSYTDEVEIHAGLPFKWSAGIQNVPIGIPVILHGKTQASYDWNLSPPGGSGATLVDPTLQSPDFTPDNPGLYSVTATDLGAFCDVDECDGGPNHEGVCSSDSDCNQVALSINAGTWEGAISGQDADGRPLSASCTGCHSGWAPDMFTPWAQSGHAEILTNNLNTSTHYGPNCFACHAVGVDTGVANGGLDDAPDYADFLGSGLLNNPGDNWTTMLADYPETAKLANIQCENCHGPNNSDLHLNGTLDPERISISSDVCAVCHGEPLRHARFQQWQLSGHANYELAIDEGGSGSCSRCHTGNGFLAWLPVLLGDEPGDPTASVSVDWTPDEVHPQTCVTCHDPHNPGTTTGVGTDSKVRIYGNTPPLTAGFTAYGVGNGAICMTCHNSRRGERNDSTFPDTKADGDEARAPHGSAQADMLMGQNAYLVSVGSRGSHSLVDDSCVNCHMEQTPPPDLLAYNLGGTNHTFSARDDICGSCHGFDDAAGVQSAFQGSLGGLQTLVEEAILQLIADLIDDGNTINLDDVATIDDASNVLAIEFGEYHGRQSITVTLAGVPDPIGPLRMPDVLVVGPDAGELYDTADDRLPKAGWNWNLANNDGSKGVHNPDFTFQVLEAGIDALMRLAAESAP
jgi:formate-dependent nitrite reductase cytochrome c552 subunit